MRHACLLVLPAVLLVPGFARAEGAPVAAPPTAARAVTPIPQAPPREESVTLAANLEILSPLGGAGCFYRGRHLTGAIVVAGSLISGGLLLYALQHDDRDATIVNAVAYGVMRAVGIAGVAVPDPPPARAAVFPAAAQRTFSPPSLTTRTLGLSYQLSF